MTLMLLALLCVGVYSLLRILSWVAVLVVALCTAICGGLYRWMAQDFPQQDSDMEQAQPQQALLDAVQTLPHLLKPPRE